MADDDDKVIFEDDAVGSRNMHDEHECVAIVRMQEKYSTETAEKREETTDDRRNTERAKANCAKKTSVSVTLESLFKNCCSGLTGKLKKHC